MVEKLQQTLAAEHAAMWIYAFLGGRASSLEAPALAEAITGAYRTHRGRRDQLTLMIRDAGGTPVAAAIAYESPDADTTAQIAVAALDLERGAAATYSDLVAHTTGAERAWAIRALVDAAVRQLGFGGTPTATPGLPPS